MEMAVARPSLYGDLETRLTYIERTLSIFGALMIVTSLGLLLAALWRQNSKRG